MRLNRTAQIGLIVIVFALILAGIMALRRSPDTTTQANAASTPVVPTSTTGDVPPPESGVGYRARVDIPERTILTRDMFLTTPLNESESDDLFVTDFRTQGAGYVTARPILKDRKVQQSDLLGHISELGVSAAVRDGFRALTIPVTNKTTLHDIVAIGDYVDVVATFDQAETRVLADGVRVLAVDVFGANYEKASVAKRGGFRGDDRPGGAPPPPPAQGQPALPPGEAAPTPTPAPGTPQQARPEATLTLEVRPEQAAAIALAQASNAPLDYLIQPRPTMLSQPVLTEVRLTKPQVAPYAVAQKRNPSGAAPSPAGRAGSPVREVSGGSGTGRARRSGGPTDAMPNFGFTSQPPQGTPSGPGPMSTGNLMPVPTPKRTYDITIYPDGLPPRTNTVPLPE